jgi:flagellar motor switch protein FliG
MEPIIQISEKQAKQMMEGYYTSNDFIAEWKEKGYIKKSLLEEARESANKAIAASDFDNIIDNYQKAVDKYEEFIIEELGEIHLKKKE